MSGAGRGRGWLNLGKNTEAPRPGGLVMNNCVPDSVAESQIPAKYDELIKRIQDLNVNDDGIMFNRKTQLIQKSWEQSCNTKEDVEHSVRTLHELCLSDIELAKKLVTLVASPSFQKQEMRDCNLKYYFITQLQNDFERSSQMQADTPIMFRNFVHILGDFYSRARLSHGAAYRFLAEPMVTCLLLLLDGKTAKDYSLFTTQWYLNGSCLDSTIPEETLKVSLKIRSLMCIESHLSKECRLWLLLAIDLYNIRFGTLSSEIYKFYEEHLGSTSMINFQRSHDTLCVQTIYPSKVLDSYQSNVNVLQISTSPTESNATDQCSFNSSTDVSSDIQQNSNFSNEKRRNDKPGRPILGTGARFNKNTVNEENGIWNNKPSKNPAGGRPLTNKKGPPVLKNNKAWEHDDRFENDYN